MMWNDTVLFCQSFRKEVFFSVYGVFWGGKNPLCGLFWKGFDSNKTSKLRQIQDSFMKTCFCLSGVSLIDGFVWFFCQSVTLAKPLSSVWVFWVYPFLLPLAYMWQTILWTVGAPNSAFYSFSLTKTSYFEEERKKCSLGKITFES